MGDQQPADEPAAGEPDEAGPGGAGEASTVDAPARWSGSAPVSPAAPRKSRNSRRAARLARPDDAVTPTAAPPEPDPTAVDPHDWASIPAVDPWADQDTPWDAFPFAPEPPPAPPVNRVPVQPRPVTRPPVAAPTGQGRPLPPPPPWAQRPPQRPLPAPRRRRRRGRRFLLFALLGLLCCGGPLAYYTFPAARQYPVNAVLPQSFLDLDRRDDDTSKRAAGRLAREAGSGSGSSFAGVYSDGDGKRVTVFGVTGWRLDPGKDVRTELDRLSDEFDLGAQRSFPAGEFSVYEQCAVGRSNGTAVVVCAWADHGSLATVLLTRRSLKESATLVGQLRGAVLSPGITGRSGGIPLL